MANEISTQARLSCTNNGVTVANATTTKAQTQQSTLSEMYHAIQVVGTSRETVAMGDVPTTAQYSVLLRNTDATNFVTVEVEYSSGNYAGCGIMLSGETWGPVRMPLYTAGYPKLTVKAETADCSVEVVAVASGNPDA